MGTAIKAIKCVFEVGAARQSGKWGSLPSLEGTTIVVAFDWNSGNIDSDTAAWTYKKMLLPGPNGPETVEAKQERPRGATDLIDAVEAKAIGLVNDVVPARELQDRVRGLAGRIAEKSPIALRMAKEAVKTASRLNLREGLDRETDLFSLTFASEDKTEGVRAFLEKRKPDFKGR